LELYVSVNVRALFSFKHHFKITHTHITCHLSSNMG
jgi:hypothetical protein